MRALGYELNDGTSFSSIHAACLLFLTFSSAAFLTALQSFALYSLMHHSSVVSYPGPPLIGAVHLLSHVSGSQKYRLKKSNSTLGARGGEGG